MAYLMKWNYNTRLYEPFESPAKRIVMYSENMQEHIDCTNCGNELLFGDGYTSKTIHNDFGLGYPVCEKCYEQELKDWRA